MKSKTYLLIIVLITITGKAFTQVKIDSLISSSPADRIRLYKFFIPSSVNGADIAPSAISNFNVGVGDAKTSFKYGRPFSRVDSATKSVSTNSSLKNSWSLSFGLKANEGVSTLYKNGSSLEYDLKGGLTFSLGEYLYNYVKRPNERSTEIYHWINVIPKFSSARVNVFTNDIDYRERGINSYSILVNYNIYYHSSLQQHKFKNSLTSLGFGVGRLNNYENLDKVTRENGILTGSTGMVYFSKKDEITGRLGDYKEFTAGLYYLDIYKSLLRSLTSTIYLGGRLNGFFSKTESNANGSLGMYFSFTGKGDTGDQEEKFGFAIAANETNLKKINNSNSFKDNFYVSLSLNIPLNFSFEK